jgi:hypothetical protein
MSNRFSVFTVQRPEADPVIYHGWRELSEATGLTRTALNQCIQSGFLPDGAKILVEGTDSHPRMGRPQIYVRVKLSPDDVAQAKELAAVYNEDTEAFLARLIKQDLARVAAKSLGFRV